MQITATIFKSPVDQEKVREIIQAGADILRIKFAHVSNKEALKVVEVVKKVINEENSNTKILVDLPEHKIRLGSLELGKEDVVKDKIYTLKPAKFSRTINNFIPVDVMSFKNFFKVGDKIMIGDGEVFFEIKEIVSDKEVKIIFPDGGFVDQYRSLISNRLADDLNHCEIATDSLKLFQDIKPDYVAISFVASASHIQCIRVQIKKLYGDSWRPKILAKVESLGGLNKIEEIIDTADEIVIARGDLGVTTDYAKIILEQKKICYLCKKKNKPVIVATQILGSCLQKSVPARSEIGYLTNIVLDGATGIWLSQETSLHENPGQVVKIAKNIINTIEKSYESV
ncbi:MAG: pyruvate kinase [Candidatus Magasanikbacteria bacterium]